MSLNKNHRASKAAKKNNAIVGFLALVIAIVVIYDYFSDTKDEDQITKAAVATTAASTEPNRKSDSPDPQSDANREVVVIEPIVQNAYMKLCNLAPYKVWYAVHAQTSLVHVETKGWWHLEPGECGSQTRVFENVDPNMAVYIETSDSIAQWLHGLSDDETIVWSSSDTSLSISGCANPVDKFDSLIDLSTANPSCLSGLSFIAFNSIEFENNEATTLLFDPVFDVGAVYNQNKNDLETVSNKAKVWAESLARQKKYDKVFFDKYNPSFVTLGIHAFDNDPNSLGVIVTEAVGVSPLNNDAIPFKEGDTIYRFNGETVLSVADLIVLLYEHASSFSKGIEEAYTASYFRDEISYDVEGTYFFNESNDYIKSRKQEFFGTAAYSALSAMTFGLHAEAKCGSKNLAIAAYKIFRLIDDQLPDVQFDNYEQCRWWATQSSAILAQVNKEVWETSAWIGYIANLPRTAVSKTILRGAAPKIAGSRRLGSMLVSGAFEGAENSLWVAVKASPLSKPANVFREIQAELPFASGIGFLVGAIGKKAL